MTGFGTKAIVGACEPDVGTDARPPSVLIVEDEAIIAMDIRRLLIQTGFGVAGRAQSGAQALREIERERPDIVLMDIHLKGDMDGVQTAEIIRSRYGLPVIYLT